MATLQAHETLAVSSQYCSSSFRFSDGHAVNGFMILLAKNTMLSKFLAACIKGRGRIGLFVSRSVLFEPGCIDIWTACFHRNTSFSGFQLSFQCTQCKGQFVVPGPRSPQYPLRAGHMTAGTCALGYVLLKLCM